MPSRSTTYGLFLAAASPLDFWPVVLLQAAAAVWVIAVLLRTHQFSVHPFALPAIVAALAATTALPWLASLLLTDIFAGLAVLAFHALVWHCDRIAPRQRLALVVFIAFAVSTHSATYAVLLALGLAALVFSLAQRQARAAPRARARDCRNGAWRRHAAGRELYCGETNRLDAGRLWHRVRPDACRTASSRAI